MKQRIHVPFSDLYARLKPLDKMALLYFISELQKGVKPVIRTRYGDNAAIALSYAGLIFVKQENGQAPFVSYVTSRGMAFSKHIRAKTTVEELANQLPDDAKKKLRPSA